MKIIFIIGISRRTGTNYLDALFAQHPDYSSPPELGEDFIVYASDYLMRYEEATLSKWSPKWMVNQGRLLPAVGEGLRQFLNPQGAGWCVTHTPSTIGLHNFRRLFPDDPLILIVRDGRDLAESGKQSFGIWYEFSFRQWKASAHRMLDFKADNPDSSYFWVRYEELLADAAANMEKVLHYCGIDKTSYPFEKTGNTPIKGSSQYKEAGEVHWKPIEKKKDFDPTKRASAWTRCRHYRFNWICGDVSRQMGYSLFYESRSPLYYGYNVTLDVCFWMLINGYNLAVSVFGERLLGLMPRDLAGRVKGKLRF